MTREEKVIAWTLLKSKCYDEMTDEEMNLVVEYETESFKPRVDELKAKGWPVSKIEDEIHDWWLDYKMANGTEDELLAYANQ